MKLGEAILRVKQIDNKIISLDYILSEGPRGLMVESLDQCNALLAERQSLSGRIEIFKQEVLVDDSNSISEVETFSP